MLRTLLAMLLAAIAAMVPAAAADAATYTWAGSHGEWSNPSNWSPNGVPGAADTAVVASPVNVSVIGAVSVGRLELSGNAVRGGGGTLTILQGGAITDAALSFGRTVIAEGATVAASGVTIGTAPFDGAVLENRGTLNLGGHVYDGSGGSSALQNDGTLNSGAASQVHPQLTGAGTTAVNATTMSLRGVSMTESAQDFSLAAGATLELGSGIYRMAPGATIGGPGRVLAGGGRLETAPGSTLNPGTLEIVSGPGDVILNGSGTVGTLRMNGGRRLGTGPLTVTADLDTPGTASFFGDGTTIVQPDESFAAQTIQLDQGHRLRFEGDLVRTGGFLLAGNGTGDERGTFEVGGTLVLPAAGALGPSGGEGVLRLLPGATYTLPAGAQVETSLVLQSSGTVTIAGRLLAYNGVDVVAGTTTVNGSIEEADVLLNGGRLAGGGTMSDAVRIFGGTLAPVGAMTMQALLMSGGTLAVRLDSQTSFSRVVAQTAILDGTLAVDPGFAPAPSDEFRIVQTTQEPLDAFDAVTGVKASVRKDATGAVLHGFEGLKTTDQTPTNPTPTNPGPTPPPTTGLPVIVEPPANFRFSQLVRLPKCAKRRSVRVTLVRPAMTVTVRLGRRTLKKSSRAFTLKRLPKRAFTLRFEVELVDGRTVKGSKRFRACRRR